MQKPEVLSASRAAGFNKQMVMQWFHVYEKMLRTLGLESIPSHFWNSGLQDHFTSAKVVGHVGQPCMQVCLDEKGETTTTCLAAVNAEGAFCHTMVIFKAKQLRAEWLQHCPKKVTARISDNG